MYKTSIGALRDSCAQIKQPAAQVVETVAAEVIEQHAPSAITVTEAEEIRAELGHIETSIGQCSYAGAS